MKVSGFSTDRRWAFLQVTFNWLSVHLKKRVLFPLLRSACSKMVTWNSYWVQYYTLCSWNFSFIIMAVSLPLKGRLWISSGKILHNTCHRQVYSSCYHRHYITSTQDLRGSYFRKMLLGRSNQQIWNWLDVLHGWGRRETPAVFWWEETWLEETAANT